MAQDWDIRSRTDRCAISGHEFEDGEAFYTLLFKVKEGFERQDLSEDAWLAREGEPPFSFWKTKYEKPSAAAPETLPKESAEDLLRRFMEENSPEHTKARYILALMLERKKLLRPVDQRNTDEGKLLIYEHAKTGDVFVVPDPQLRLDELGDVQTEVAQLLQSSGAMA